MSKITSLEQLNKAIANNEPVSEVQLYWKGIETFPAQLFELKDSLTHLYLESNSLTELPPEIATLTHLKSLSLNHNNDLSSIPQELGDLSNLESLNLSSCGLKEFPTCVLKLKKLRSLRVNHNEISEIPVELAELTTLEKLGFHDNQLTQVPSALFNLTNLTEISLSDNELEALPENLGNLVHIDRLLLYRNKLKTLPASIGELTNLEFLQVEDNELQAFPEEIGNCILLDEIRAKNNQLQTLPESIGKLVKLERLGLNVNQLKELPKGIGELSNLHALHIANNQLTSLPDVFENLVNLRSIELANNQLTTLPKSMKALKNISNAYLEKNPFTKPLTIPIYWDSIINLLIRDLDLWEKLGRYEYRKFFEGIRKSQSDPQFRMSFYHLLAKNEEELSIDHLIEALCVKFAPLQTKALTYIQKHYAAKLQEQPIQQGSEVVMLGTIALKKNEVKARLKDKGIKTATKIKKTTTHVVLGKNINKYEGYDQDGLVFLTDIELNAFLEANEDTYLKEADTNTKEDIIQMLLSQSHDAIGLALEMLKQGGVAEDYITGLFLITKNPGLPNKLRKTAKGFLEIHGVDTLKKQLTSRTVIFKDWINEDVLEWNIDSYMRKYSGFDKKAVGKYISEWTGNGYRFWFNQLEVKELDEVVHNQIRSNPKFTLKYEYLSTHEKRSVYDYPTALRLSLRESHLKELPTQLKEFKQLTFLDLGENSIKEIPEWIEGLTHLKRLNIGTNKIKEFPAVLEQMENLEDIRVYDCSFVETKEIPDCFDLSDLPYGITRK